MIKKEIGRPEKYKGGTKMFSMRIPKATRLKEIAEIKKHVNEKLSKYLV